LLAATLLGWFAAPLPAEQVEHLYARGLYPLISRLLVPLSSAVPWSLSGTTLLLMLAALPVWMLYGRFHSRRSRERLGIRLWRWSWCLTILALLTSSWFLLAWGINYRRTPIEQLLALPSRTVVAFDVERLARSLTVVLQQTAEAPTDEAGALSALRETMSEVVTELTGTSVLLLWRVKRLPAGTLLTFGYAGITSPFWLEPHIDAGLSPPARVATAAHELAHAAGFAREADAEVLAALAGLASEQPFARYSVALNLFARSSAELPRSVAQDLTAALPQRARRDLQTEQEVTSRYFHRELASGLTRFYDRYLRTQGIAGGVGDYSRAVGLLATLARLGRLPEPVTEPP